MKINVWNDFDLWVSTSDPILMKIPSKVLNIMGKRERSLKKLFLKKGTS